MKAQPKAVFVMLATFAVSASANTLLESIKGRHELSGELENVGEVEETRTFDVVETMPDRIDGDNEEEDEHNEVEKTGLEEVPVKATRSSCLSTRDRSPSARRNGQSYDFELRRSNAQCRDSSHRLYPYGGYDGIRYARDCADACVSGARSNFLSGFRGYDWDCFDEKCHCLFDDGILKERNVRDPFDFADLDENGRGPVRGGTSSSGMYCFILTNSRFVGMNDEVEDENDKAAEMESRRGLRGPSAN